MGAPVFGMYSYLCGHSKRGLKEVCHDRLVHCVYNSNYTSLFAMELENWLLVNDKITASCQQLCLLSITSNVKNNESELWKTVWLTGIVICFNLLQVCSSALPFVFNYSFFSFFEKLFLCFTLFVRSFHCFDFDKFCDTVPLSGLMIYSSPLGILCNNVKKYYAFSVFWKT